MSRDFSTGQYGTCTGRAEETQTLAEDCGDHRPSYGKHLSSPAVLCARLQLWTNHIEPIAQ